MVIIDKETCIGCGLCAGDCLAHAISLEGGRAEVVKDCFHCGHCVAICPTGAVRFEGEEYDMRDVEPLGEGFGIAPEQMLHAIKSRRTIRQYQKSPLSRAERNAYTLFFAGVVMSRLTGGDKERMFMVFGTKEAGKASNIMQTAITADSELPQNVKEGMQDSVQMMRQCATFIADDFQFNADDFAVNEVDEKITMNNLAQDVANQFVGLIKEIQE